MRRLLPSLGLVFALTSAHAELPIAELKRDEPVNFATEVYPFLKANCLACHNSTKAKADLILESPQDMIRGGDTGPSLVPGDADASFLFTTAAHLEEPTMPPANNKSKAENLTPEQLALLKRWIDEGAKGDVVSTPAPESWTFLGGPQPIYTAAVSEDGRFAAAGRGQRIDVYDLRLGRLAASLRDPNLEHPTAHRDLVQAVAFSPDGTIASGGYRNVKIWQRSEAVAGETKDLPARVTATALSPDRQLVASGLQDGSIVLVKAADGSTVAGPVKDHAGAVTSLAFSPDGKALYSTSADKTVKRRTVAEPAKSTSLALPAPASAIALIDQGRLVALGGADQVLRIARADLTTPMVSAPPAAPAPAPAPAPKPSPTPAEKAKAEKPADPKPAAPKAAAPKPEAKPQPNPQPAPKPAPKPEPAPKPKPLVEFKLHAQPIVAIEPASADGREFLVAHGDGTVIHSRFDPAKPEAAPTEVRRIAHGSALDKIAVSLGTPGGPRLATAGPTGAVKLWNLADGKAIADLQGDPALTPRIIARQRDQAVAARVKAHWDRQAPESEKLWKAESEKAKQSGESIAKARRDLSAKQQALAELEAKIPAATDEELAKAREGIVAAERTLAGAIRNRESSARLAGDAFARQTEAQAAALEAEHLTTALKAEEEALRKKWSESVAATSSVALAFSPDGSVLAHAPKDTGLRLWSATDGAWLEDAPALTGTQDILFPSAHGVLAVSAEKKITPWSLPGRNWALAKQLGNGKDADPFVDRVSSLAFSPDGEILLTGTGVPSRTGRIAAWNTADWTIAASNDEAHEDTITAFAFSPGGDRFASSGTDQFVKVFETATLAHQRTFEGHTSHVLDVDWNTDDLTIASSGADLQVKVWDLTRGQEKSKVEGFQKEVSSVAFVGATETLLTASGDATLKLSNQPLPEAGGTFLHTAAVSEDGKRIVAGGQDSVLRVWDADAKKLLHAFESPEVAASTVAAE